jgi:hypothetical protein
VRICVHAVPTRLNVLDKAETKGAAAVLIALELRDGSLGRVGIVEADHSAATRSAAGLVLDLGLFDLADGREQLDEIFIASGPRELRDNVGLARAPQVNMSERHIRCGRKSSRSSRYQTWRSR